MLIYDDGSARLYHGDCVKILPELHEIVDLVVTSPPYDDLRKYGGHAFNFDPVADMLVSVLAPGGVIVWVVSDATIDGSETGSSFRQALGFMERGLRLHDTMIYEKALRTRYAKNRYFQSFDYMFVFSKGAPAKSHLIADVLNVTGGDVRVASHPSRVNDQIVKPKGYRRVKTWGVRGNIWRYSANYGHAAETPIAHKHPAIFPLNLAQDHIQTWSDPGRLGARSDVRKRKCAASRREPWQKVHRHRNRRDLSAVCNRAPSSKDD